MNQEQGAPEIPGDTTALRHTQSIQRYLRWLTFGTLLPTIAVAIIAAYTLAHRERDLFERSARERTLAVMTAVDAQLKGLIATLEALAASSSFDADDLAAFDLEARRVIATQPEWLSISLAVPSAQQVVNVLRPFGAELPPIQERASFNRVLESGRPQIGDLIRSTITKQVDFAVRVPVIRDGKVRYVLSAVVTPESIYRIWKSQQLPGDWIGVVVDRNKRFVARTPGHAERQGQLPSKDLEAQFSAAADGWKRGTTLDGAQVYTAHQRSSYSGWSSALGIPASEVNAAAWRVTAIVLAGTFTAAILAFFLAHLLCRKITKPIVALAESARMLARGEVIAVPSSIDVTEVADLGAAMTLAGAAIEARKALEAERRTLLEKEQRARKEAEDSNRAKDEFLAMLGHELRNPLAAISTASYLLDAQPGHTPEPARDVIQRQSVHLARLVDDLLDAARVASGKIVLAQGPVNLSDVITRTLATLETSGRTERHRISSNLQPVWVLGDETRLEQIVTNLLTNAVRYTPVAGVITITLSGEANSAVLRVADSGIGMPAATLPHVFELFMQGNRGLDRAHGGLGIGLTLVRRLTELHGGSVEAASDGEDCGSTFTVRLPRINAPAVEATPQPLPAAGRGQRILLVEDNEDARAMLRALLELEGHSITECGDGPSGLTEALNQRYDTALLDVGLPGLNGYDLARSLRSAPETQSMKLIAVTGYGQPQDRHLAFEAGFDELLVKPVDPQRLMLALAAPRPAAAEQTLRIVRRVA